jgi:hypothetical protein
VIVIVRGDNMVAKNEFIMILSPYSNFNLLLQEAITSDATREVVSMSTMDELEKILNNAVKVDFVIFDMDLGTDFVYEGARVIRERFPGVHLVLVSKKGLTTDVEKLDPWKVLWKPFIAKDLIEVFNKPSGYQEEVINGSVNGTLKTTIWWELDNQKDLASSMTNILFELDAIEAFLYSSNGIIKTNITGVLKQDYGTLAIDMLLTGEKGEVIKVINVNSKNYILHGVILATGIILGLLYSSETPYSHVRKQSSYFIEMLKQPNLTDENRSGRDSKLLRSRNVLAGKRNESVKKLPIIIGTYNVKENKNISATDISKIINNTARAGQ